MRRSVNIEFKSPTKIKVTNRLWQREFDLNKLYESNKCIDLIEIKTASRTGRFSEDLPFFADIEMGEGTMEEPYALVIYAVTGQESWGDAIGDMWYKNVSETFSVTLPY